MGYKNEKGQSMGPQRSGDYYLKPEERLEKIIRLKALNEYLEEQKIITSHLKEIKKRLLNSKNKEATMSFFEFNQLSETIRELQNEIEDLKVELHVQAEASCEKDLIFLLNKDYDGNEGRHYEQCLCVCCSSAVETRRGHFPNIITKTDIKETTGKEDLEALKFITNDLYNEYLNLLFKYTEYYFNSKNSLKQYNPQIVAKILYNKYKAPEELKEKPYVMRRSSNRPYERLQHREQYVKTRQ